MCIISDYPPFPSHNIQPHHHSIEEAADGQIAVDKVQHELDAGRNYDVILMDFVMPVMDGPTATRAIRAMGVTSPIFGLTGNVSLLPLDNLSVYE